MQEVERWLTLLEEKGGRVTNARRAIVDLLVGSERTLSPIDIFDQARQASPKMGLVTVYRTLELLEELGLVERVHQENDCHCYVRASRGHEHLVLCTNCGRVVFFSGDDLGGLIQKISQDSGFTITGHWLQLQGLCASCRSEG